MKSQSWLTMESLIHLSEKLSYKTGRSGCYQPYWSCVWPLDYPSWYCRTHVLSCPEGMVEQMAQDLAQGARDGLRPPLVSVVVEDVPETFIPALERNGFVLLKPQTGMLLEIDRYEARGEDPHVVEIGPDRLMEWSEICAQAFSKENEPETMRLFMQDPSCHFYAYEDQGRIVGTLLMSLQYQNAGLHEVGTLKECRGRGICHALLNRAFLDARAWGYPLMSLQASIYGRPVYETIGMRPVCQIRTVAME